MATPNAVSQNINSGVRVIQVSRKKILRKAIRFHHVVSIDCDEVERAIFEHYKELLGSAKQGSKDFEEVFLPLMPKLSEDAKASIEAPINLREIRRAIDELTTGKSPGPDGFGAEYYKFFKEDIAVILYGVIVEAYETKRTPPTYIPEKSYRANP